MTTDHATAIEAAWERRDTVTPASAEVRDVVEAAAKGAGSLKQIDNWRLRSESSRSSF